MDAPTHSLYLKQKTSALRFLLMGMAHESGFDVHALLFTDRLAQAVANCFKDPDFQNHNNHIRVTSIHNEKSCGYEIVLIHPQATLLLNQLRPSVLKSQQPEKTVFKTTLIPPESLILYCGVAST